MVEVEICNPDTILKVKQDSFLTYSQLKNAIESIPKESFELDSVGFEKITGKVEIIAKEDKKESAIWFKFEKFEHKILLNPIKSEVAKNIAKAVEDGKKSFQITGEFKEETYKEKDKDGKEITKTKYSICVDNAVALKEKDRKEDKKEKSEKKDQK